MVKVSLAPNFLYPFLWGSCPNSHIYFKAFDIVELWKILKILNYLKNIVGIKIAFKTSIITRLKAYSVADSIFVARRRFNERKEGLLS